MESTGFAHRKCRRIFLRKNYFRYERKEVLLYGCIEYPYRLAIEVAKKAEVFINAQEMSSQGPAWSLPASSIPILDSAEEIQRILEKK